MRADGFLRSAEWLEFEKNAVSSRRGLERALRREMVHDPRAASARLSNLAAPDLADEAFTWTLEQWKAKPASTSPEMWMRKHAFQLLDEALDREALAAESRAEERAAEQLLVAQDLPRDDEERAGWFEIAALAGRDGMGDGDGTETDPFDGLASDPLVSSPAARLDERETLVEVERALLRLPERRRRAVAHRFLDGLPIEEIAYLLDIPAAVVRDEIAAGISDLQRGVAARA